jgi:uncharacterized Zn finger protein (UPF0148 family)
MRNHAKKQHNLTDLRCDACGAVIFRDDNLKVHIAKHCSARRVQNKRRTSKPRSTYSQSSSSSKQENNQDQRFDQRVNCQERQSQLQTLQVI